MLSLIMPFHDQSPSYAYGFEAGKLYAEMQSNKRVIEGTYHECNHQQLLLSAQTNGYKVVSVSSLGDDWVSLRFEKPVTSWLLGFVPSYRLLKK